jgi:uncharacterized protein involved in tolerance to divalent cations
MEYREEQSQEQFKVILKTKTAGSSEMLEPICQTSQYHIPQDSNLHSHWYENLKSQLHFLAYRLTITSVGKHTLNILSLN